MNGPEPLRPISYVRELRQWGDDDRPLRRAVRSGRAVRIHRGAFMTLEDWSSLTREQRHRHQAVAATRAGRSRPTLSHRSAAIVWGVPSVEPVPRVVDVLSSPATGTRTEGGYRRHSTTRPDVDVCVLGDARITGFTRTMAEYAAQAAFTDAVVALDWAFRAESARELKPSTSPTQVLRVAEELGIQRGRRKLLRAVSFADPKSGSPGESASRVGMHLTGFPPPELQVEFRDHSGLIGFTDFWWPGYGLIGEFDGLVKYTDQRFAKGQPIDQIVIAEKKREDRLRALPRVRAVSRWLWPEALNSYQLAGTLTRAGLPRARR